jgi:hypothetical protein
MDEDADRMRGAVAAAEGRIDAEPIDDADDADDTDGSRVPERVRCSAD